MLDCEVNLSEGEPNRRIEDAAIRVFCFAKPQGLGLRGKCVLLQLKMDCNGLVSLGTVRCSSNSASAKQYQWDYLSSPRGIQLTNFSLIATSGCAS